jgi:DNA-binding transcriptional MerR regulator
MTAEEALKWVQVVNALSSLGVPIAKLVMALKAMLTDEQVREVLLAVQRGWRAAQAENDARIAELQAQVE